MKKMKRVTALLLSLMFTLMCIPCNIANADEVDKLTIKNVFNGGNVSDTVIDFNGTTISGYSITCDGVTPTKFEQGKTYRIFLDNLQMSGILKTNTGVILEADVSSELENLPTLTNGTGINTYYKSITFSLSFDFEITVKEPKIIINFDPNGGKGIFAGKLTEVEDIILGESFEKKYMVEPLKETLGTLYGIYDTDKNDSHPGGTKNFYGATLDLSGLDTPEKVRQLIGCGFSVTCTTCTGFICFKFIDGTGYSINHVDGVEFDTVLDNYDQSDASVVFEIGIADCNNGTDVIKKIMTKGIEISHKIYNLFNKVDGVTSIDLSEYGIDYVMTKTAGIGRYEQMSGNGLYKFTDGLAFDVVDNNKVTKTVNSHEILYGAKYNDGAYDSKLIIIDPRRENNSEPDQTGAYKLENAIYKTAVKQGVYTKAEHLLSSKTYMPGANVKDLPNAPYGSPDGNKVFIGWTTTKDDETTLVKDEDLLNEGTLTLYALWLPLEIVEQPTKENNEVIINANPKWNEYKNIVFSYQIKNESGSFDDVESLNQTGTYRYKISYGTTTIYSNEFEYVKSSSSKKYKATDDKNTAEKITGTGKKGSTRTIIPEEGKKVKDVIVKDKDGKVIEVTDNGDGTYSFKQPASDVIIEVLYGEKTLEEKMQDSLMKDDVKIANSNEGEKINPNAKFVRGYEDGEFKPNNEVTNIELMCMVTQLYEDSGITISKEIDLNQGDNEWAGNIVALANGLNLIPGNKNNKNYNLYGEVTRGELAKVVYNLIKDYTQSTPLKDRENCKDAIGKDYEVAVSKLVDLGVLKGYDDGLFHGDYTLTRAEAVVVINRALQALGFKINMPKIKLSFPDLTSSHWAYNEIMYAANK